VYYSFCFSHESFFERCCIDVRIYSYLHSFKYELFTIEEIKLILWSSLIQSWRPTMRIICTRCRLRIFYLLEELRILERVIVEMSSRRTRINENREDLQELSSNKNKSRIFFVKAKQFIWIRYRSNHEIRFAKHSRNVRWIFNREIKKEMCLNKCRLSC
jgi:hypothetical protein